MTSTPTRHSTEHEKPRKTATLPSTAPSAFRKLMLGRGDQDPFPLYAQLREHAPVLRSPLPRPLGGYVLSRYAECSAALRNRALVPVGTEHIGTLVPDWEERQAMRYLYRSMVFQDATKHARIRRRLSGHFSRSRMHKLHGFMADTAEENVRYLAENGAHGRTVDLVENLTLPYPLAVIGTVLGIPSCSMNSRLGWSGRALSSFLEPMQTAPRRSRIDHAAGELVDFFTELVEQRSDVDDVDDIMATLIASARDDELSDLELIGNLLFLFIAGFDSSTSFLGSAIEVLLDQPDQAAKIREDPSIASSAVTELLRYAPPVHATSRIALEPVVLSDVEIPEGALVWILLASANRDPAYTENPDQLDVTRTAPSNLSFAAGAHTCVGAPLARMEAEILLPRLLERFPEMSLAGAPRHRSPGTVLRGIDHLPVVLAP